MNVAVTVTLFIKFSMVHAVPALMVHPDHPPNVPLGTAVKVTVVPVGKLPVQEEPGVAEQPRPAGELEIVPVPVPAKSIVTVGPVPVKQTTLAVMLPLTTAPEADRPEASALVCRAAEMIEPPHALPVTVNKPLDVTVMACGKLDAQVTWFVISLVTGGWTYVPMAVSCACKPASCDTGMFAAPKVSVPG